MDKRDCDREAGLAAGIGSTNVYFRHSTLLLTGVLHRILDAKISCILHSQNKEFNHRGHILCLIQQSNIIGSNIKTQ
ncbi:hypothetical protein Hanom_Chr10g00924311 [Helianthus anomalus]